MFALLVVTGEHAVALFAAFGSFSRARVLRLRRTARPRRFRAYCCSRSAAACCVALGHRLSPTRSWPAVGGDARRRLRRSRLCGALGGYFAAGGDRGHPRLRPRGDDARGRGGPLASRELGWIVGVRGRGRRRHRALAGAPARSGARGGGDGAPRGGAAPSPRPRPTVTRPRCATPTPPSPTRAGVVYRPAGSITRERALVALVIATRRLAPLLERVTAAERSRRAPTPRRSTPRSRGSRGGLAGRQCADRRPGGVTTRNSRLDALDRRARCAHRRARACGPRRSWPPTAPRASSTGSTATFPLRRLSLAAIADRRRRRRRPRHDAVRTARATAAAALAERVGRSCGRTATCVRCGSATRRAPASASRSAVLVAKTTSVEHAFWVVLGALSVLRSNALGTGATALQALAGRAGRLRGRSRADRDDRWRRHLAVDRVPDRGVPRRLHAGRGELRRRAGGVHGASSSCCSTSSSRRVAHRARARAGHRHRRGHQRRRRCAPLAPGRARRGPPFVRRAPAVRERAPPARARRRPSRGRPGDVAAAATAVATPRARAVAALEDLALEHGGGHVGP